MVPSDRQVKDMGEAKGIKFFRDLVAGNGRSVHTGHTLVVSGEVPLALTVHHYMPEQLSASRTDRLRVLILDPAEVPDENDKWSKLYHTGLNRTTRPNVHTTKAPGNRPRAFQD